MSNYAHLSTPNPEFAEVWAKVQALYPPPGAIHVNSQRHAMDTIAVPKIMEFFEPKLPPHTAYRVTNNAVGVENGEIMVRCIQPVAQDEERGSFPLLVWIHGGGSLDIDDYYLRILSVELRLTVVNVGYRLAPEHPFPVGLNDSYAALKWSAVNASELSASLARGFLVGGASGGATFAAVLAHRARDDPFFATHNLTGQILQIPGVLHPHVHPEKYNAELLSLEQNKDAPILTWEHVEFFFACLQGEPSEPELSPLLLSHEGLPQTYIQVLDPLRDEVLLYERLLCEAGVKTRFDVYPGVPHAFHVSFSELSMTKKWEKDIREGIRWLLSTEQI
ncbi:Alpha/Beta hydrolase protein [Mycena polygramma]|nr:Alpha/Beta hydrolase protein [Mycena polygramma]